MVDAVVNHGVIPAVERQIDGLAHLAALEQGGIALGRHLNDFVLGRVQPYLVFARLWIGLDGHRVAGDVNLCGVAPFALGILQTEGHQIVGRLHRLIVLLADEPRGVVALQLHHNLQRVAQVVLRQ